MIFSVKSGKAVAYIARTQKPNILKAQDMQGIQFENHIGKYNVFHGSFVREQDIPDWVRQAL